MFAGPVELGILFLFFGNGMGLPLGVPPQPVDVKIDQAAPDDCLVYFSWVESGDPSVKSVNRLERVLADIEFRQLSKVLWKQLDDGIKKLTERDKSPEAGALAGLVTQGARQLIKGPGALYLAHFQMQPDGFDIDAGLMLGVGEAGPSLVKHIDQFLTAIVRAPPTPVKVEGVTFHRALLGPGIPSLTWGLHRGYLLFGVGDTALANSVQRTKTPAPQWLTQVTRQLPVQKRSTLVYVNLKAGLKLLLASVPDPDVPRIIKVSGLENLTHLATVSGFDGEETVARSVLGINGKRTGFFAVAGNRQLERKDLQRIPADAVVAIALRLDAGESVSRIVETLAQIEPRAARELEKGFQEISRELEGYDVRRELFPALGDLWTAHTTANNGSFVTGWVFSVRLKDRVAAERGLQQVMDSMRRKSERDQQRGRAAAVRKMTFAGEQIHYLAIPDDDIRVTPAWCLRKDELVVSLFPQALKSYLKHDAAAKSLDAVPQVAKLFQAGRSPTVVVYTDTRELFKWAYPLTQVGMHVVLAQLQRGGVEIDSSILPTAGSIAPHLGSAVTAWYLQEDGVYVDRRQSVPGIGGVAVWLQGMMFFTLQRQIIGRRMDFGETIEAVEDLPRR
ncbi:MAG: hypothetical protein VB912_01685 [Pirellulaceae bacterium]